jgi:hypothetical protein
MSKYNNIRTVIDNISFMSKREAERYRELKMFERCGSIQDLKLQPKFVLQEGFIDRDGVKHSKISYIADFSYIDRGELVVEDVKGMKTSIYKLKKKLFLFKYNYKFIET